MAHPVDEHVGKRLRQDERRLEDAKQRAVRRLGHLWLEGHDEGAQVGLLVHRVEDAHTEAGVPSGRITSPAGTTSGGATPTTDGRHGGGRGVLARVSRRFIVSGPGSGPRRVTRFLVIE